MSKHTARIEIGSSYALEAEVEVHSLGYYNSPEDCEGPDASIERAWFVNEFSDERASVPVSAISDDDEAALIEIAADLAAISKERKIEGLRDAAADLKRRERKGV